jgi:dihydrofolate reductase
MGKIMAGFSISLDGFIAGPGDDCSRLFAWMFQGDTDLKMAAGDRDFELKVSAASAERMADLAHGTGAIVSGRRMFDTARAWGGKHPMGVPVFVVTHNLPQGWPKEGEWISFVTDGLESALAQARKVAGDRNIGVGGANITRQCLKAGLLDEIHLDLVPVLLGQGVRLFEHLGIEPLELESTARSADPGVTHLTFRVIK